MARGHSARGASRRERETHGNRKAYRETGSDTPKSRRTRDKFAKVPSALLGGPEPEQRLGPTDARPVKPDVRSPGSTRIALPLRRTSRAAVRPAGLLELDGGPRPLERGLGFVGVVLVDPLEHWLGGAVHQVLGLLQAQAGERANLLDDLDLLVAGSGKDDVELRLLLLGLGTSPAPAAGAAATATGAAAVTPNWSSNSLSSSLSSSTDSSAMPSRIWSLVRVPAIWFLSSVRNVLVFWSWCSGLVFSVWRWPAGRLLTSAGCPPRGFLRRRSPVVASAAAASAAAPSASGSSSAVTASTTASPSVLGCSAAGSAWATAPASATGGDSASVTPPRLVEQRRNPIGEVSGHRRHEPGELS